MHLGASKALERATNQSAAGQTHNSSNSAEPDGIEDTGGAAGFAAPTYSTLDISEVEVPTGVGKAVDNFPEPQRLRSEGSRQQSYTYFRYTLHGPG